ncbi:hypothetical protein [Parabacteroides faecis]|uniref:hypothetical protein n=1 Tax=Parabacteroides faecis TaxID=1217282 RepID=UPI003522997C
MVRLEKNKLLIELSCRHIEPESELISLYQDIVLILRSQDKDLIQSNKYAMDHLLGFLSEIMLQPEQLSTKQKEQS